MTTEFNRSSAPSLAIVGIAWHCIPQRRLLTG
jgi:hypothetical protein